MNPLASASSRICTQVAVQLLSLTFETATSPPAEAVDRLLEHISLTLNCAENAIIARQDLTQLPYFSAPSATLTMRRQSQNALRHSVMGGVLPGNRTNLATGARELRRHAESLKSTCDFSPLARAAWQATEDLAQTMGTYSTAYSRLSTALARGVQPRVQVADSAVRLERSLLVRVDEASAPFRSSQSER